MIARITLQITAATRLEVTTKAEVAVEELQPVAPRFSLRLLYCHHLKFNAFRYNERESQAMRRATRQQDTRAAGPGIQDEVQRLFERIYALPVCTADGGGAKLFQRSAHSRESSSSQRRESRTACEDYLFECETVRHSQGLDNHGTHGPSVLLDESVAPDRNINARMSLMSSCSSLTTGRPLIDYLQHEVRR